MSSLRQSIKNRTIMGQFNNMSFDQIIEYIFNIDNLVEYNETVQKQISRRLRRLLDENPALAQTVFDSGHRRGYNLPMIALELLRNAKLLRKVLDSLTQEDSMRILPLRNLSGYTTLAYTQQEPALIRLLLERGADPNVIINGAGEPFIVQCLTSTRADELIRILIDNAMYQIRFNMNVSGQSLIDYIQAEPDISVENKAIALELYNSSHPALSVNRGIYVGDIHGDIGEIAMPPRPPVPMASAMVDLTGHSSGVNGSHTTFYNYATTAIPRYQSQDSMRLGVRASLHPNMKRLTDLRKQVATQHKSANTVYKEVLRKHNLKKPKATEAEVLAAKVPVNQAEDELTRITNELTELQMEIENPTVVRRAPVMSRLVEMSPRGTRPIVVHDITGESIEVEPLSGALPPGNILMSKRDIYNANHQLPIGRMPGQPVTNIVPGEQYSQIRVPNANAFYPVTNGTMAIGDNDLVDWSTATEISPRGTRRNRMRRRTRSLNSPHKRKSHKRNSH